MINPYLRAAQIIPALRQQAIAALELRHQGGAVPSQAENEQSCFNADDTATAEDEAQALDG